LLKLTTNTLYEPATNGARPFTDPIRAAGSLAVRALQENDSIEQLYRIHGNRV